MKRPALAVLVLLPLLAGCGRIRMETPEGFAPLPWKGSYRAVSPEGVRLQAHWVDNDMRMSLDFWIQALGHQLRQEGYATLGEAGSFQAGDRTGATLEWSMPLGDETWSYLTGLLVVGKRVLLVQAAGEQSLYARYRAALLRSLTTLRI